MVDVRLIICLYYLTQPVINFKENNTNDEIIVCLQMKISPVYNIGTEKNSQINACY